MGMDSAEHGTDSGEHGLPRASRGMARPPQTMAELFGQEPLALPVLGAAPSTSALVA